MPRKYPEKGAKVFLWHKDTEGWKRKPECRGIAYQIHSCTGSLRFCAGFTTYTITQYEQVDSNSTHPSESRNEHWNQILFTHYVSRLQNVTLSCQCGYALGSLSSLTSTYFLQWEFFATRQHYSFNKGKHPHNRHFRNERFTSKITSHLLYQ